MGRASIVTPSGCNASFTAPAIAAGAPRYPASPEPFCPKVVNGEGVQWSVMAMAGTSSALARWFESQGLEYGELTGKAFVEFERHEQAVVEDIVKRGNLTRQ